MGYSADSFTAGEQPTTAKWNKLWANDASFNDGTGIGANVIDYTKVAVGFVVQTASTVNSAVNTGTTLMPYDDTIPQITEGTEFMTLAITPKSATNRLFIEADIYAAHHVAPNDMTVALFQDATANALAAGGWTVTTLDYCNKMRVTHDMVAGTTSSTTFRIRLGASVAGTYTFNGSNSARKYGGITLSTIKIMEYKA